MPLVRRQRGKGWNQARPQMVKGLCQVKQELDLANLPQMVERLCRVWWQMVRELR